MMNHDELVQVAIRCGADKAAVIARDHFVLNESFRDMCKANSCGQYNRCWACPPSAGEIGDLIAEAMGYDFGLLYQTISPLEDSYDIEGMADARIRHDKVTYAIQAALKDLPEPKLLLSCGGCKLCERCAKLDSEPCRHPEKVIRGMEVYGFNVYETVQGTGMKYINGPDTVTYFGILLFRKA